MNDIPELLKLNAEAVRRRKGQVESAKIKKARESFPTLAAQLAQARSGRS